MVTNELIIVLDGDHESDRPGYISGNEDKIGNLADLWPSCEKTELFGTILAVLAESWQIRVDQLTGQDGWLHNGNSLAGHLKREIEI